MINLFEEFKALLLNPEIKNVLILPHNLPDGDTLGSAIGIQKIIEDFNKSGYIVLNDDIPSNLLFLFEGNTKLVQSKDVEQLNYQLIVVVDTGETKLIEDRLDLMKEGIPVINIDHHITNNKFGNLNIVEPEASSTGELVYTILEYLNVQMTASVAQGLYAAIVTDTGSFRYSNTRPYTFRVCEKLIASDFDFNRLNVELFQNKSFEKLILLNKIFDTLALYFDGKCAVVKLTQNLKNNLKLNDYDTDGVVEYVRDISGVEVVVFIKHMDDGTHKISMRSKNHLDVSKVATRFQGGGHKKAAGFKTTMSDSEIETQLLNVIKEVI